MLARRIVSQNNEARITIVSRPASAHAFKAATVNCIVHKPSSADDGSGISYGSVSRLRRRAERRRHEMDALVRRYIHDELLYRYIIVQEGKAALAIEAAVSGALGVEADRS